MPSSPAEATLLRLAELYGDARAALAENGDDLERPRELIAAAESLLAVMTAAAADGPADGPAEQRARRRAQEAHAALTASLVGERHQAREMLAGQRRGQRMLAAYGRKHTVTGTRIEQDG